LVIFISTKKNDLFLKKLFLMVFKINTELLDFQNITVDFICTREQDSKNSFILSDPGTGKTITLLKVIEKIPVKTLIICPANLIYNWVNEIEKHSNFTKNDINIFHGSNKTFRDKLITITSYSTIVKSDINKVNKLFTRVVLDEGHVIRNIKTTISKIILTLTIPKRIIMTATPIFNKLKDLYPLFKFLDLDDEFDTQCSLSEKSGLINYKTINSFVKKNSIRFTKAVVLKDLKPNIIKTLIIDFSPVEREFYDMLINYCNNRIAKSKLQYRDTLDKLFTGNILVFILRLKQCVNSPYSVLKSMKRLSEYTSLEEASVYLKNCILGEESECDICFDRLANIIAEPCGHSCCKECWARIKKNNSNLKCPYCRKSILSLNTKNDIIKKPLESIQLPVLQEESTKINKVIQLIDDIIKNNEKVVVVSQYINTLNDIKGLIKYKYIEINGKIPLILRQENVIAFDKNSDIKVCFLSMTAGSEGINLISANHLILIDLYWNQAKIDQVSDRINRIGQTRQTFIYKINITNTIERQLAKLISKKQQMSFMVLKNLNEQNEYLKEMEILEESISLLKI
jgi:SWI/SNF-related matrix-associated actin-dependent regulator of chromatin subfamily A3